MSSGRIISCISDKGYRCSGSHLVSYLLEEFFVVFVYRYDVASVLDLDGVSGIVTPSCKYYSTVHCCLDDGAGWCCDVKVWVDIRVVSLGNDSLERGEEVESLYREIPLVSGRYAEFFLFPDGFAQQRVFLSKNCGVGCYFPLCLGGIDQTVDLERLPALNDSAEIF